MLPATRCSPSSKISEIIPIAGPAQPMAARGSRQHRRHNDGIGIIAVDDDGAELEDDVGSVGGPSGPGDPASVSEVSAGLSQAWRLLGGLAPPRLDGAALRAWWAPGWIKVEMEFRLEPAAAGTLLSTETRILATDPSSRRFFAAYWFLIRASSAAIRREVRSWCQPWSNVIRRSKRSGECRLVCPDRHFLTPGFAPTPGIR